MSISFLKPALALAVAFSFASPALADEVPLTTQIVDLFNKIYGTHPGFRANHAKGIVVEGHFTASKEAATLSRAALFDGSTIPVTVRFSDGGGLPTAQDADNPHGMAIKYHLKSGADTDMVIVSLKSFPVGTGEEFRDLLLAISESGPDKGQPTDARLYAITWDSEPAHALIFSGPRTEPRIEPVGQRDDDRIDPRLIGQLSRIDRPQLGRVAGQVEVMQPTGDPQRHGVLQFEPGPIVHPPGDFGVGFRHRLQRLDHPGRARRKAQRGVPGLPVERLVQAVHVHHRLSVSHRHCPFQLPCLRRAPCRTS